jgi:hypothetical protein
LSPDQMLAGCLQGAKVQVTIYQVIW